MRNEETKDKKQEEEKWLNWAIELQSLAQAGLAYGKDKFDIERFERIREIAMKLGIRLLRLILELQFLKMIKFYLFKKVMESGHCQADGQMYIFQLRKMY